MLRVTNRTPFTTHLFGALDSERRDVAVVVVKGTFALGPRGETRVADEQEPVVLADVHYGEPGASSVRYESDLAPEKLGTDVVLLGSAYAPRGASEMRVTLSAGRLSKALHVRGERRWMRDGLGRFRPSAPARFDRIELVYENAFGGTDALSPPVSAEATRPADQRNPVGIGFIGPSSTASPADLRLPLVEDPASPIASPTDRPAPAGFGFIHRSWWPRSTLAGTFDAAWRNERAPYLPRDFDPRFHQGASPLLVSSGYFLGGEPVRAEGVRPGGALLELGVPRRRIEVKVRMQSKDSIFVGNLDTLVLEPDASPNSPGGRMICVWRAVVPCPRKLLQIERVTVSESS